MMLTLGVSTTSITSFVTNNIMRYIPMSQYSFDEICEQCRAAINRSDNDTQNSTDLYTEVRKFYHYDRELITQ
jgi:ABC-type transporter lipoprotein component MlaA